MTRNILLFLTAMFLSVFANHPAASENFLFNGHKTHLIDKGKGPVIILVHGLGADVSKWKANIGVLAKTHRVIALDLLGFGKSDKPNVDYRIQLFVDQISALMDDRGIEQATLVGNSMGGLVALSFAEQQPDRVSTLVLVAPAFVYGLPSGVSAERLSLAASPDDLDKMKNYLNRIYHKPVLTDAMLASELAQKRAVGDAGTIRSVAKSLYEKQDTFTEARIRKIDIRTKIIHGDSDGVVPIAASSQLEKLIQNASMRTIKNTGHWPQLERPEAFNRILMNWVQQ